MTTELLCEETSVLPAYPEKEIFFWEKSFSNCDVICGYLARWGRFESCQLIDLRMLKSLTFESIMPNSVDICVTV